MAKRSAWNRREFLRALGSGVFLGLASGSRAATGAGRYPFSLGVASGYPAPDSVVLWTRVAPDPLAPMGGMPPEPVPVFWEVARDQAFRAIVADGVHYATPDWAHSVHVEVMGLRPDHEYWYRFRVGDAISQIGRTRTAPVPGRDPARLRFGLGSCQHFEQGWFVAHRHIAEDALDLFVHVGDYIYESSWGRQRVRRHGTPEPYTLDDYRSRYALYKSDPDLQAAHATCPWLVIWDDHEVDNDYAASRSENDDDPAVFLRRRAAAYRAYYEHMPLRRSMMPSGPNLRLHTRVDHARLARFHLLDDRQYRSRQPCAAGVRDRPEAARDCRGRDDPAATMLGREQEQWLQAGLEASEARWNFVAQQTLMAQVDFIAGPEEWYGADSWDGYPAARRRLLEGLAVGRPSNPVVLGGDLHSFWVTDLKTDFLDDASPVVATEFVTTSITSDPVPERYIEGAVSINPHVSFATGLHRGYLRLDLTAQRLIADLRAVDSVQDPASGCATLASFVVENGRPGATAVST
ncbi:MAG: alkaline phosphatase D family protein [Chromatiaceae bacterium]